MAQPCASSICLSAHLQVINLPQRFKRLARPRQRDCADAVHTQRVSVLHVHVRGQRSALPPSLDLYSLIVGKHPLLLAPEYSKSYKHGAQRPHLKLWARAPRGGGVSVSRGGGGAGRGGRARASREKVSQFDQSIMLNYDRSTGVNWKMQTTRSSTIQKCRRNAGSRKHFSNEIRLFL